MLKIKYLVFLSVALFLTSCSDFQKVLNKGNAGDQYKMAVELYDNQKYSKALQLFEKVVPAYRNKPQQERIQFMVAQSYYNVRDYSLAAYHFDRFTKNYPKSSKVKEAKFLIAKSYFYESPRYTLDQQTTYEALSAYQLYINTYPDDLEKIEEANKDIATLQNKIERKAFETAYQYYHMEKYSAAVAAFDNFMEDYLGSSFKEEALYWKFMSSYQLGMNSVFDKKEERLDNAIKIHDLFLSRYPESEFVKDLGPLYENLLEEKGVEI